MTYQETIEWMFSQLPMYQRQGKTALKKDLTNILAFCDVLKHPEHKFKSIHVGGTNGKGSTSHILSSVLQEAGYRVGLYTSPHLKNFTERIRINGEEVSQPFVVDFISKHKNFLEQQQLSFFEMTVGMAFEYFATQHVDIAIIEVGLGGRLDSTNIINPEVSVITNIGYDHTQFLGDTLKEIAFEKAGIIKNNTPIVIGEKQEEVVNVFLHKASEMNADIHFSSDIKHEYTTDLLGRYQEKNIRTALQTFQVLEGFAILETHIRQGLLNVVNNTNFKGRWQILQEQPKVICDTAHNKEGLCEVLRQLSKQSFKNLHIVLGVVNDKKLEELLPLFPKYASYYFCKPNIPRGLDKYELELKASCFDLLGNTFDSVNEAYAKAILKAEKEDLVFIGGSTFVVAEVV
ncbi:bifunctional folylpolyglutamate synthase/dihydrofolate synthase [Flavobacteriaceae bacterium]|nr:bifunctional folylpolyglutamate synthase/dihydrofolate synthase [Flavobacteriaceae bacterium]